MIFLKLILINVLFTFNITNSDFCNGFEDGYKQGYCYQKINCITPVVPNCPVINVNEKDNYKDGYNRGFMMGIKSSEK